MALNPGMWNARSLRSLASKGMYDDEFVNGVPVLGNVESSRTYHLSSAVYTKLIQRDYDALETWTKRIPSSVDRWVFAVCVSNHWTAIEIDWKAGLIQHYDPMHNYDQGDIGKNARKILNVGTFATTMWTVKADWSSVKRVKGWVERVRANGSQWRLDTFAGPRQPPGDSTLCGVLVAWVLRGWMRGEPVGPTSLPDPLSFIGDTLNLLRYCPRIDSLPAVGETQSFSSGEFH